MVEKLNDQQIIDKWKQTRTPDITVDALSFKPVSEWEKENVPKFFKSIFIAENRNEAKELSSVLTEQLILEKWRGRGSFGILSGEVKPNEERSILEVARALSQEIRKAKAKLEGKVFWNVQLRKVSEQETFPFTDKTVPFIKIDPKTMTVTQAKTINEKRQMLLGASDEDLLLAAWPGRWSQDVFEIDDRSIALEALS